MAIAEEIDEIQFTARRQEMVRAQLAQRDITDDAVLRAMARVPRHRFVPWQLQDAAYGDHPLPIGNEQTISQPYVVAWMTQLARAPGKSRALDVGTGSGYQAAILAEVVDEVFSIELIPALADAARERLRSLGYGRVQVACGDGRAGWVERAPFDAIIVAAAAASIPGALEEQLAPGGRLVIPVGPSWGWGQELVVVEKDEVGRLRRWTAGAVQFVRLRKEPWAGRGDAA